MAKKSRLVTTICLILVLSIFSTTTAMAASNIDPVYTKNGSNFNEPEIVRPQSAGVAVFVAGIIVGYVIDGIFIYASGHSVGELTAAQIDKIVKFVKKNPQCTTVHMSSSGDIFGGSGREFRL